MTRRPLRDSASDPGRDRTVFLNQFLLSGVAIVGLVVVLTLRTYENVGALIAGGAIAFLATGAALLVPWNRVPPLAMALIPASDVVAIALLREGAPSASFGLLWVFPAMWAAWAFGRIGTIVSVVAISAVYWAFVFTHPDTPITGSLLLLPITIAAAATITYIMARRANGQRDLLERQAIALRQAVGRATRQEDLLSGVLEAVDFGVIRVEPDGRQTVANEAHARLAAASEASGDAYLADGLTPLRPERLPLARAVAGEEFDSELVWFGAPGTARRALSITAKQLRREDGASDGALIVTRDVTREMLAVRARDDLVATVSHELRNPLTTLLGYLELGLDDPAVPDGPRRGFEIAERNAQRLLLLVTDILAASSAAPNGAAIAITPAPMDVVGTARAAIESAAPLAASRGATIQLTGMSRVPAFADELRVRQVLDNLLSNAIKYGREGGRIELVAASVDGFAVLEVHDDGPGIVPEDLTQVFDRYYRADAVRKTSTHGYGLGLPISRQIARAHGGDLVASNAAGAGAVFRLTLPSEAPDGP